MALILRHVVRAPALARNAPSLQGAPTRMRRATREDIMADLSDPNFWIAVGAVGTGVTAVAAGVFALFSWLSSRDAANAAQTTLYRSFQKEYASPQINNALDKLSEFFQRDRQQNLEDHSSKEKARGSRT